MRSIKSMEKTKKGMSRFLLTTSILFSLVIIFILLNHDVLDFKDGIEDVLLVLFLALPISTFSKLLSERMEFKLTKQVTIDIVFTVALSIFYLIIPEEKTNQFMVSYFIVMWSCYLIFTLIPYFYKRENYSLYILKLLSNLGITILFSAIINLGIIGIVFITDTLFELDIESEIYTDVSIIIWIFFGVIYFLGRLPKYEKIIEVNEFPKILKVLITYILIPIILVYTSILYMYFVRLLLIREFPINILNQIVVWYAFVSIIILFLIRTIKDEKNYLKKYYKYYPILTIVPLLMLYTSLIRRIMIFGVTPPRYFALIVSIWITVSIGYIYFSKKYKGSFLVVTGIVLLLISSFGPQNAFNVSFHNQNNRFEKLLEEIQLLEGDNLVLNNNISEENQEKISEFLKYFDEYDDFDRIEYLGSDFELKDTKEYFGFEHKYYYNRYEDSEYIHFYSENTRIEIDEPSYIYNVNWNIKYLNDFDLEIYNDISKDFDLEKAFLEFSYDHYKEELQDIEDMVIVLDNGSRKITVFIERLNFRLIDEKEVEDLNFEGIIIEKK